MDGMVIAESRTTLRGRLVCERGPRGTDLASRGTEGSATVKPRGRLWLKNGSRVRLEPPHTNHVWSYDFVSAKTYVE